MKNTYLDRNTTAALKGIALLMMFVHHFFLFPDWYISGISYPGILPFIRYLKNPTQMCVVIFAFITGYFYCFSRAKTLRHSLMKIRNFLISYWTVLGILLLPALLLGFYNVTFPALLEELLGLGNGVMIFCWYVSFYTVSMLILPVLVWLSPDHPAGDGVVFLILPVVGATFALGILQEEFGMDSGIVVRILNGLRDWFPCIGIGYLCAKYRLFETYLDGRISRISSAWGKTGIWILLCAVGFFGKVLLTRFQLGNIQVCGVWTELRFSMDIFYGPVFVYGAVNLLRRIKTDLIQKPLIALGNQSMNMWFFHCVFFNCCKEVTQPVVYLLKNPLLVLLTGLGLCYLAAVLTDIPVRKLLKKWFPPVEMKV